MQNSLEENENRSFHDEEGNVWVWDGEEYVIIDENGIKWLLENNEWIIKASDGKKYRNVNNNWYPIDEFNNYTVNNYDAYNQFPNNNNAAEKLSSSRKSKSSHHKHHKKHKHKENITINATLPKREKNHIGEDKYNITNNINTKPLNIDPRRSEIIKLDSNYIANHRVDQMYACPIHKNSHMNYGNIANPPMEIALLEQKANTRTHTNNNSEYEKVPFFKSINNILNKFIGRDNNNNQKSSTDTVCKYAHVNAKDTLNSDNNNGNSKTERKYCAETIDNENLNSLNNTSKNDIIYESMLDNKSVNYDPSNEDLVKKYAYMLRDYDKIENEMHTKTQQLAHCVTLIEKINAKSSKTVADDVILYLAKTMQSLIKENMHLEEIKNDRQKNRFWSPDEAYKSDALYSLTLSALNDSLTTLKNAETFLFTYNNEVFDFMLDPNGKSYRLTTKDLELFKNKFTECISKIFSNNIEIEQIREELKSAKDKAYKLASASKSCPCRPSVNLLEDEKALLNNKLCEVTRELNELKKVTLTNDIIRTRLVKKNDFLEAQLKALLDNGAPSSKTVKLINEGVDKLEQSDNDLMKRIEQLEKTLALYTAQSAPSQIAATETLTAKLFELNEEDKKLARAQLQANSQQAYPDLDAPPLRTVPIVFPPNLPAIELKLAGDETGSVARLASILEKLIDLKTQNSTSKRTQDSIDKLINNVQATLKSLEAVTSKEEESGIVRKLSKNVHELAFETIPASMQPDDARLLRELQTIAQKTHKLAVDLYS